MSAFMSRFRLHASTRKACLSKASCMQMKGVRRHQSTSVIPGSILSQHPDALLNALTENGLHRAYFVTQQPGAQFKPSSPCLSSIAAALSSSPDYRHHEAVFIEVSPYTKHLLAAFVHKTSRGPGAGGVRFWSYDSAQAFFNDGLRLSEGMGRKNALAGLWWGGGKGVIARHNKSSDSYAYETNRAYRDTLFAEYGSFMTSLRGPYVTAEDAGVNTVDMAAVFSRTRFTTCAPTYLGGSGNPSVPTGLGIVCAMEGAVDFLSPGATLRGLTVAVQGLGNVAVPAIKHLFQRGVKHVVATDINVKNVENAKSLFRDYNFTGSVVPVGDVSILSSDVDIVSPCALGGILNEQTIKTIKAKIVCGAANNQLLDDKVDDARLQARNITYVPDFLANRMGIVNCANENYGYLHEDPAILRHFGREWENSIFKMVGVVLSRSRSRGVSTALQANELADELAEQHHPVWPNRSRQIIDDLVNRKWEQKYGPTNVDNINDAAL